MKKLQNFLLITGMVFTVLSCFISCKKESYLTNGGVASANTSLSTYDYLKGNEYNWFDTTILVIDHFNLKDSVNNAGTFFAFTNFAVDALMKNLNCTSLDQFYDSVSSKLITQYMFSDTSITLANAGTTATIYTNWASDTLQTAVKKQLYSYVEGLTSSAPVFNYYILQYIRINGVLDGSPGAPANDKADNVLPCQTTGIKTSSGTTLHVLANSVLLNRF